MWGYYDKPESVGERRERCEKEIAKRQKAGDPLQPVLIEGRKIATTYWGKSWCDNIESYADYAYRIDRGRSYVRHRSVIHLEETGGELFAYVLGTSEYEVRIKISEADPQHWEALKKKSTGKIDSILDLLSGGMPDSVMADVANPDSGLFPKPDEIKINCNCPDWAGLCKHAAAVLYGIGNRLDSEPELLFRLRGVNHEELVGDVASAVQDLTTGETETDFSDGDLSSVFGIDLDHEEDESKDSSPPPEKTSAKKTVKKTAKKATKRPPKKATKKVTKKAAAKKKTAPKKAKKAAKKGTKKAAKKKAIKKAAKKAAKKSPKKAAKKSTKKAAKKSAKKKSPK